MYVLYICVYTAGQNPGVGSLSFLQGVFPTQASNPGLLHCRQILYQLSHKGSPRMLEGVAYPFSRGSSWTRNWTRVSCIQQDSSPTELPGKPTTFSKYYYYTYWIDGKREIQRGYLPKITHLVSGRDGVWTQAIWLQGPGSKYPETLCTETVWSAQWTAFWMVLLQ